MKCRCNEHANGKCLLTKIELGTWAINIHLVLYYKCEYWDREILNWVQEGMIAIEDWRTHDVLK